MLTSVLTPEAKERLARVSMVRPENARAVEDHILGLARSRKLQAKVDEVRRRQRRAHKRARECISAACARNSALTCARANATAHHRLRLARMQNLLVAMLEEVSKQAAAQSGAVKKVVNMRKKRAGEDDDDEDDSDL